MYVVLVKFRLAPDFVDAFRPLVLAQAVNSLEREEGCRRFDVAFDPDEPTACLLYELYDDRAAFDTHLKTGHFKRFDADVSAGVLSKDITFWTLYN
ncbi:Autoinducer 2-degrading protein LsrG [Planctomycetes bacterium MalM25]|nr:Autoinducer 2-degrading protein LsrG [Planctomycetes bacterium MalM25]